jgi:hypothetical protein
MTALRMGLVLAVVLVAASPGVLRAQQVRVRSTTTGRYIEMRPIVLDTASDSLVAAGKQAAAPITEDLEISAWGLGVRGLRAYGFLRFRDALGSELVWPRSTDHFDALWAFVELERESYRVRLGRQQRSSALGFYAFDGGLATWRPLPTLRLEGYLGRGLARGYLGPYSSSAISAMDPFIPNTGSVLMGASVWAAPMAGASLSAIWQRELTTDWDNTISDRAGFDAQAPVGRHLLVRGSADADLTTGDWGKSRLAVMARLPYRVNAEVALLRYRPLFGLNTIWGVFSPDAYSGFSLGADATVASALTLSASYSLRNYRPTTDVTPFYPTLDDQTHTVSVGGQYVSGDYLVRGSYRYVAGYGGGNSGGDAELAYDRGGLWHFGVTGMGFQEYEEFRVARGTVFGAGVNGRAQLAPWLSVRGDLTQFWHTSTEGGYGPDWSQLRGLFAAEITFGTSADRRTGGAR